MLDHKYRKSYKMILLSFEHLILELNSFLCVTAHIFVRPLVPIRKQMSLVVYRLAQSFFCKTMKKLYECKEFTIREYMLIVCRFCLLKMDCSVGISIHL